MNRLPITLAVAALVLMASPVSGLEQGRFSMEVLVDGRPLQEWPARGRSYVEALEGREYAIRLRNRTAERVAVALTVDGLNTIDASTTSARDARKWILGPWQTITLEGWQTGHDSARRFYFTSESDSYGAWLGESENLGLISAAFFREKQPPQPVTPRRRDRMKLQKNGEGARAPRAEGALPGESERVAADEDHAATGIGREVEHRVRQIQFEAEPNPARLIELRYEYRDALVQLGVIPDRDSPLARRERARGFRDGGFAPDPYRDRR